MAIEYIIETVLLVGFMLSVLVVCKWIEDLKQLKEQASRSEQTLWQLLRKPAQERCPIVDQVDLAEPQNEAVTVSHAPVVYLKVSNSAPKVQPSSVREKAEELAQLKKAVNSE